MKASFEKYIFYLLSILFISFISFDRIYATGEEGHHPYCENYQPSPKTRPQCGQCLGFHQNHNKILQEFVADLICKAEEKLETECSEELRIDLEAFKDSPRPLTEQQKALVEELRTNIGAFGPYNLADNIRKHYPDAQVCHTLLLNDLTSLIEQYFQRLPIKLIEEHITFRRVRTTIFTSHSIACALYPEQMPYTEHYQEYLYIQANTFLLLMTPDEDEEEETPFQKWLRETCYTLMEKGQQVTALLEKEDKQKKEYIKSNTSLEVDLADHNLANCLAEKMDLLESDSMPSRVNILLVLKQEESRSEDKPNTKKSPQSKGYTPRGSNIHDYIYLVKTSTPDGQLKYFAQSAMTQLVIESSEPETLKSALLYYLNTRRPQTWTQYFQEIPGISHVISLLQWLRILPR